MVIRYSDYLRFQENGSIPMHWWPHPPTCLLYMTQLLTVAMGFSDSGEIPCHAQVNHQVPDEQLPFMGEKTHSQTPPKSALLLVIYHYICPWYPMKCPWTSHSEISHVQQIPFISSPYLNYINYINYEIPMFYALYKIPMFPHCFPVSRHRGTPTRRRPRPSSSPDMVANRWPEELKNRWKDTGSGVSKGCYPTKKYMEISWDMWWYNQFNIMICVMICVIIWYISWKYHDICVMVI